MGPTEIKVGGLGGQGVILGGIIIGKAAALFDGKHSCLTQAFGPEARGSACSAQVVVDRGDPLPVRAQPAHHGRDVAGRVREVLARAPDGRDAPHRGGAS